MPIVDMSKITISSSRGRTGRYGDIGKASPPPGGLPRRRGKSSGRISVAAVVDPDGNGRDRIQVQVNRSVDVLEQELSAGRISEPAYETGRVVQEAFQHIGNCRSGSNWSAGGSGIDARTAAEHGVVATLDRVRAAAKVMARVEGAVGTVGARFMRRILIDSISYTQAAAERGRHGHNAGTYAGERFRDMLEDLSFEFGAKGKDRSQILTGISEDPDTVHVEPSSRPTRRPIVHGQSTATKAIGRRTLAVAVEAGIEVGATAGDVVRRGIRPRG